MAATLLLLECGGAVPEAVPPVDTYTPQGCREPDPTNPCVFPSWGVNESNWKAFADAVCASTCASAEQIVIDKTKTLGSLSQLGITKFKQVQFLSYGSDSPNITNLVGLEGIEEAGQVEIYSDTLRSLNGLRLRRVSFGSGVGAWGEVQVSGSPLLEDVDALNSLEAAERLQLFELPALRSLPQFEALRSLGILSLGGAPLVASIDGFNALEEMHSHPTRPASSIVLRRLEGLQSITGFQQLKTVASISIRDNPGLDQCVVARKFAGVQTQERRIEDNGPCR